MEILHGNVPIHATKSSIDRETEIDVGSLPGGIVKCFMWLLYGYLSLFYCYSELFRNYTAAVFSCKGAMRKFKLLFYNDRSILQVSRIQLRRKAS